MTSKLFRLVITAFLVMIFAATPILGVGAEPFNIPVIISLTGPSAFLGKEEYDALTVLEKQVNASGGVRGRPIHFAIQDDRSTPQNSVELLNQAVAGRASAVLGSSQVALCGAMAPLIAANGPVVYCFSPGIHPAAGSYMFSASISTVDYIIASVRYLREKGLKKIAVLTSTDATGQDAERSFDSAVNAPENAGGVTIIDREHFNASDLSVAAQVAHIKSSGAQAAILWTVGTPFGTVLRECFQAGLDIPLITSAGNLNYSQLEGYDAFMPDNLLFMAPPWAGYQVFKNATFQKNIKEYLAGFKEAGARPDEGQSLAWDPALLLLDAYRKLGFDAQPAAIRDFVINAKGFVGVDGQYDFHAIPQRGIGIDWLVMVRWDKAKRELIAVSKAGGSVR